MTAPSNGPRVRRWLAGLIDPERRDISREWRAISKAWGEIALREARIQEWHRELDALQERSDGR